MKWDILKWLTLLCATVWFAAELNSTANLNTQNIETLIEKERYNNGILIVTSTKLEVYEKKLDKMDDKLTKIWDTLTSRRLQ